MFSRTAIPMVYYLSHLSLQFTRFTLSIYQTILICSYIIKHTKTTHLKTDQVNLLHFKLKDATRTKLLSHCIQYRN